MDPHEILKDMLTVIQKCAGDMSEMLQQSADKAADLLHTHGFSIYLLQDPRLGYGKLKIVAGGGPIGKALLDNGSVYYVPRRDAFTRRPSLDTPVANLDWEEEVRLIENGKLAMGITACVARTGQRETLTNLPDQAGMPRVYEHPEHRGKYEDSQGEKCTSIIVDCLRDSCGSIIGVVKAENRISALGFGPDDEKAFDAINTVIQIGLVPFENELSYRATFGDGFAGWIAERIQPREIEGKRNKRVAKFLLDFFRKVQTSDIRGLGKIYESVYGVGKNIGGVLELPESLLEALSRIQAIYEPLLGTDVRYREHFIHQFHVFALGYAILNSNKVVKTSVVGSLGIDRDMDEAVGCWFMAAMFHDLAYMIQRIPQWLGTFLRETFGEEEAEEVGRQTRGVGFSFDWGDLFSLRDYAYHRGNLMPHVVMKLGLTPSERASLETRVNRMLFESQDHALFSALVLMNKMGVGLHNTEPDQRRYELIKEAALAIALHSPRMSGVVRGVKNVLLAFNWSPLAFLLMFCDNAQEWGRPSGLWSHNPAQSLRTELRKIETDPHVRIELSYSNVTDDLATEIGNRKNDWVIDKAMTPGLAMSITAFDVERGGILLNLDY
jgi:hypothetical protein